MTSTIRFYSFKDLPWSRSNPHWESSSSRYWARPFGVVEEALADAATYTAAGVALHVVRMLRQRLHEPRDPCLLSGNPTELVIAGASSLLGAELKSLLEGSRFAASDFRLLDEELAAGTLTEAAASLR